MGLAVGGPFRVTPVSLVVPVLVVPLLALALAPLYLYCLPPALPPYRDAGEMASAAWTLGSYLENLTLTGSAAINGTGNSQNNILAGNSINNVLTDSTGNDTLDGGAGSDTLIGGVGDDTYIIEWGLDEHGRRMKLTKEDQVHGIGNSVCPEIAEAIVEFLAKMFLGIGKHSSNHK